MEAQYASDFQAWLTDRIKELAGVPELLAEVYAEQLTTDFIEQYSKGIRLIEDAPKGEG